MPLFTFLSGVIYAYRPFKIGASSFIKKKARRLLFPMLTVGTFYAILQYIILGTNSTIDNWYLLHIKPVAHFWFIESLFFLFIFVVIIEKAKLFENFRNYSLVLFTISLLYLSPIKSAYFSLSGTIYLLPFFLLGMGLQRYLLIKEMHWSAKIAIILLPVVIFYLIYTGSIPLYGKRTLFALLLGFLSCVALYFSGLRSILLAKIGIYSYSIYIFHVFFTAGTRIILYKTGIDQLELVFVISLVLGLAGPIIIEFILEKTSYARMFFLGKPLKST